MEAITTPTIESVAVNGLIDSAGLTAVTGLGRNTVRSGKSRGSKGLTARLPQPIGKLNRGNVYRAEDVARYLKELEPAPAG